MALAASTPNSVIIPIIRSIITVTGSSIASITKFKDKNNYEKCKNAMQGYCQINGTWRYKIGKVLQPTEPIKSKPELVAQYDKKFAKWNTICNSLKDTI